MWKVWRYQKGSQNPYIEGQTIQWQMDKQLSTQLKDGATVISLIHSEPLKVYHKLKLKSWPKT